MLLKATANVPHEGGLRTPVGSKYYEILRSWIADGAKLDLQSKSGKLMTRYFPELVAALAQLRPKQFVIDGEIVVPSGGAFSFDALLQRIHPAASRVRKLAAETPALLVLFDLLVDEDGRTLVVRTLRERSALRCSSSRPPASSARS